MAATATYKDPRLPSSLWVHVRRSTNGCWHWTGAIDKRTGYGVTWNPANGSSMPVHRRFYTALVEWLVPRGQPGHLQVDHECHNRSKDCEGGPTCMHRRCVNPAHLVTKTPRENTRASKHTPASINRAKTHCDRGHPLSGNNVRYYHGKRTCYECHLTTTNEARRQRKAATREEGWERRYWQDEVTHCPQGHAYSGDNLYLTTEGSRQCRVCRNARATAFRERSLKGTVPRGWRSDWTHCKHGHELSGDNLYVAPSSGKRSCKTCRRSAGRKIKARSE